MWEAKRLVVTVPGPPFSKENDAHRDWPGDKTDEMERREIEHCSGLTVLLLACSCLLIKVQIGKHKVSDVRGYGKEVLANPLVSTRHTSARKDSAVLIMYSLSRSLYSICQDSSSDRGTIVETRECRVTWLRKQPMTAQRGREYLNVGWQSSE